MSCQSTGLLGAWLSICDPSVMEAVRERGSFQHSGSVLECSWKDLAIPNSVFLDGALACIKMTSCPAGQRSRHEGQVGKALTLLFENEAKR